MSRISRGLMLAGIIFTATLWLCGCGGGGSSGGNGGLVIGNIQGPATVNENSSAQYTVSASGDTGITYSWTCDPASAGAWANQNSATATFQAGFTGSDTTVTIYVVVNSAKNDPQTGTFQITVKDIGITGPTVGSITGQATVNENSSAQYSVTATGDTGITYAWSSEPASAGSWTNQTSATATFNAGSADSDTAVIVKVSVDSDVLTVPIERELTITVKNIATQNGWAKTWGGNDDEGFGVAIDASGNTYVTGYFNGTVDFDPGSGEENHMSNGEEDVFLSKFDSDGNFKWAKTWGGNDWDNGSGVAIDASGDVYVAGWFGDTVDFDPGSDVDNHTANGWDIYLSKFDSSGNFEWAKTWGGSGMDWGYGIAIDASGNAYVTGWFNDTVDFDPDPSEDWYTSNGGDDVFLSKFDSSGNFKWAKTWGGTYEDWGREVDVDASSNVYVVGHFRGTVDFNPGSNEDWHTTNGANDAFLSKFDSSGNFLWAKTWGGIQFDDVEGVAVDVSGNTYVTGIFEETVDFDPGAGVENHTSNGLQDIFLSKFDSSGNIMWVKTCGGSDYDLGWEVAVDGSSNAYVTGWFGGNVDFDTGLGVENHMSNGDSDVYLSKFDSTGNLKWAKTWGGSFSDIGRGVAVDLLGNAYVTGGFWATVDFDPGSGVDNHTSNGYSAVFLSKFPPDGNW